MGLPILHCRYNFLHVYFEQDTLLAHEDSCPCKIEDEKSKLKMNKTWDNDAVGTGLGSPKLSQENLSKSLPEIQRSTWEDVTPSTGEDDVTTSP